MRILIQFGIFLAISAMIYSEEGASANEAMMDRENDSKPLAFMSAREMFSDRDALALAEAGAKGNLDRIDELVGKGVDVNHQGNRGVTPLFWAMQNSAGFRRLLEYGADPNIVFEDGASVMHWAARAEDVDILRLALEFGGDPNVLGGQDGITPIFRALTNREALRVLLDAGADIDAQKRGWEMGGRNVGGGVTPVMAAANLAQFDVVYFFLESGADYSIEDERGDTLSNLVANYCGAFKAGSESEKWHRKVVEWLRERGVEVSR